MVANGAMAGASWSFSSNTFFFRHLEKICHYDLETLVYGDKKIFVCKSTEFGLIFSQIKEH